MSFLDKFLTNFDYAVCEGGEYSFAAYGLKTRYMDCHFGDTSSDQYRGSFSVVFDPVEKKIYQYTLYDAGRSVEYVWYDPSVANAAREADKQLELLAPSDFPTYETSSEDDIFAKAHAVRLGLGYDTKVTVDMDFDSNSEEFLEIAKAAHMMDMSINQFIEHALKNVIEQHESKSEE